MLGGGEALTGIVMRETMPMPLRKAVALADHVLDGARILGGLCALPGGRFDATQSKIDRHERDAATR